MKSLGWTAHEAFRPTAHGCWGLGTTPRRALMMNRWSATRQVEIGGISCAQALLTWWRGMAAPGLKQFLGLRCLKMWLRGSTRELLRVESPGCRPPAWPTCPPSWGSISRLGHERLKKMKLVEVAMAESMADVRGGLLTPWPTALR